MSLKNKTISSGISTLASQILKFGIRIGSISILARFLSPDDYGKVAIATALSAALGLFIDAGLSTATLQKEKVSQAESSSMFWLNVGLGTAVMLLLSACGPIFASIYDDQDYILILPILGLLALVSGFTVQKSIQIQREMLFGKLAKAEVISQILSVSVAILAAIKGLGFWTIMLQLATQSLVFSAVVHFSSPWKPSFCYDHKAAKPMLRFGASIMASNFIGNLSKNLDTFTIGYFFGAQSLGFYNRAQNILNVPLNQVINPITKVARSAIFRTTTDPVRFANSVGAILAITSFFSASIIIGSLCYVKYAVIIILGEKWLNCIPIFIALTPFALVGPCASFLSSVLISKGDSRPLLISRLVTVPMTIIGLCIGIQWGVVGMATTYAATGLLFRMPFFLIYTCRSVALSTRSISAYMIPALTGGTIASSIPLLFYFYQINLNFTQTTLMAAASTLAFLGTTFLFPRGRTLYKILRWIAQGKKAKASLSDVILM